MIFIVRWRMAYCDDEYNLEYHEVELHAKIRCYHLNKRAKIQWEEDYKNSIDYYPEYSVDKLEKGPTPQTAVNMKFRKRLEAAIKETMESGLHDNYLRNKRSY